MSRPIPRTRLGDRVRLLLLLGATVLLAGSAAAQASPIGDALWPPEDQDDDPAIAELGAQALTTQDPLVLETNEIRSYDIERVNATTSRLHLNTSHGPTTVQQAHTAGSASEGVGAVDFYVRPPDLHPTVEVGPAPDDRFLLQVTGPPGSFDVDGQTLPQKAESFARQTGLPAADDPRSAWQAKRSYGPHDQHLAVWLYQGVWGCLDRSGDTCATEATFYVRCSNCTELVRRFEPTIPQEVASLTNRSVVGGGDEARVLFNGDGALVAARASLVFDINESALIDPDEAVDPAFQALEDKGYPIVEDRSPNVPDEDKEDIPLGLTIHLISPPDQATPTEAQYGWHPTVDNNGTHAEAHVFQNARTGEIERIRVESGGPIRDAPEEATNGTPGASLASIVFASVLGAVLLAARRRR